MWKFGFCAKLVLSLCMLHWVSPVLSAQKKPLHFGIVPWDKPEKLAAMYKPLMTYLSKELERPCKLEVMGDYNELVKRMTNGGVHVGFFTPKTYVTAKKQLKDLEYIATHLTLSESGKLTDFYEGVIIANKDSEISELKEAKNKTIAFTHLESSSGYVYPASLLKRQGISYEDYFSKVFFLKKHHRVTGAVAKGTVDLGATWDGELENAVKKHGDVFKVIAKTRPIPNDPIASTSALSKEERQAMRKALSSLDASHQVIIKMKEKAFPDEGFSIRDDSFYDVVRDIVND